VRLRSRTAGDSLRDARVVLDLLFVGPRPIGDDDADLLGVEVLRRKYGLVEFNKYIGTVS